MAHLVSVNSKDYIFKKYQNTPVADLLEYQNLGKPLAKYTHPKMLISMCMDYRKNMHIPEWFAYVIRTGGANLRSLEFIVSYAIAVGGIKTVAIIGHNNCGMVGLATKEEKFINGLVEAGWETEAARQYFRNFAPLFEIGNELDFLVDETKRLRVRYPKILIAPLMYQLENNKLYLIDEDNDVN